jgi:PST family polysaccharide transporter
MKFERSDKNVGSRVAMGAAFLLAGRIVTRLFSLANVVILARLLTPDDYGVAALAMTVIAFLQLFSDLRVNQAIVALKHVDSRLLNTGFTMNLARGVLIGLVMLVGAELLAAFTREPRLADVMRALAIVPVLDGLRNPAFMLFRRQIQFKREFWMAATATALGFFAALGVALVTRDYWAIVAGTIIGRGAESAFTYFRLPFRPRISLHGWRQFLSFGGWSTLDSVMLRIANQSPTLLLGRYAGSGALGFFNIGYQISRLVTRELSMPLTSAFMPGLAAVADNEERLRSAYRRAQAAVITVTAPIGFGIALLAPQLVMLLAGEKWLPQAADVVRWTAPAMTIAMVAAATDALATARLALRPMALRSLVFAAIMVPIHFWAASTHGLKGIMMSVAAGAILLAAMRLWMASEMLGDGLLSPFRNAWRALLAVAVMVAALIAWPAPPPAGRGELVVLADTLPRVALGAFIYLGLLYALWRADGRPDGIERRVLDALPALRRRLGLA